MSRDDRRTGIFAVIGLIFLIGVGLMAWGAIDELLQMWTRRDWWWPF